MVEAFTVGQHCTAKFSLVTSQYTTPCIHRLHSYVNKPNYSFQSNDVTLYRLSSFTVQCACPSTRIEPLYTLYMQRKNKASTQYQSDSYSKITGEKDNTKRISTGLLTHQSHFVPCCVGSTTRIKRPLSRRRVCSTNNRN